MIEILHRARKYKKPKVQSQMEERCANDNLEEFVRLTILRLSQQTDAEVDVLEYVTCID